MRVNAYLKLFQGPSQPLLIAGDNRHIRTTFGEKNCQRKTETSRTARHITMLAE
jgi:hypothetical protein